MYMSSDLSISSRSLHRLRALRRPGSRNILSAESTQNARIRTRQGARASIRILHTRMAEVLLARSRAAGAVEQLTRQTSLLRQLDVLEHVALSKDLSAGVGLESVLGVGVEVVVDCVEERVAADLGGAAGGVVDVVLLQGDEVVGASQINTPIVLAVAGSGPGCCAINVAVGNGDAVGCTVAEDDVLAGDKVGGYVIDPDEISCASPLAMRNWLEEITGTTYLHLE
jgi:hypothetical protein